MRVCFLFICIAMGSTVYSQSEVPFQSIPHSYTNRSLMLPKGFSYNILYSASDSVVHVSGVKTKAKDDHDMTLFIPKKKSSNSGWVYVNHEEHKPNYILGDGGGGAVFKVKKKNGDWIRNSEIKSIDFSSVGETFRNCGGTLSPTGTVLTTEEEYPQSNIEIMSRFGIRDTSDFQGRKKYENFGYVVEVDPLKAKALRKLKSFGRYPHEDVEIMPDGKTIFLSMDDSPCILFKFICEQPYSFDKGILYAFKFLGNSMKGEWIALPGDEESLNNISEIAISKGASLFLNHEWIERIGNKLYIAESGTGNVDLKAFLEKGATIPFYINRLKISENKWADPFGRILELDLKTNELRVYLEGGVFGVDSMNCFSSPDGLGSIHLNGKDWLVICEDTHGWKNGKAGQAIADKGETYNEVYFLDANLSDPTLKDLHRFMMLPEGSEPTGISFTPDKKTMFLSVQHPSHLNPPPFNHSCVIAINGF